MAKHVCSLYDLIRSNSDTNQQKNWKEVENRVKAQVPLRIMSCVQLASKLTSHYKVRGRRAGKGGGGERVWMISEKNILQTVRAKKKSCKEITAMRWLVCRGKNYITRGLKKKFLTQGKSPTLPSKVKRSARK